MNRGKRGSSRWTRYALVLIFVIGVTLTGTAITGLVSNPPPPTTGQRAPTAWQPDKTLVNTSAHEGEITVKTDVNEKVILIDRGHENRFSKADIQPLVAALTRSGHEVRFFEGNPGDKLHASLEQADAFIVINPSTEFTPREAGAVAAFTIRGGRLLMLGEPSTLQPSLFGVRRVHTQYTTLGSRLGIAFGTGYLYNMHQRANNYQSIYVTPRTSNNVTAGIDRVVMHDATPVTTNARFTLLGTRGTTRLSTTRKAGRYVIAVGAGNVVAIGDTSFLAAPNAYDADNEVLIGNLAEFLVTGNKTSTPQ